MGANKYHDGGCYKMDACECKCEYGCESEHLLYSAAPPLHLCWPIFFWQTILIWISNMTCVCVCEYSFFHLGKDSFHFGTLVVLKSFSVPSFVIFYSLIRQFYFLPLFITRDTELTNRIQWFWRIDLEYEDSENVYSFVCMAFVRPNMQKWQTSFLD